MKKVAFFAIVGLLFLSAQATAQDAAPGAAPAVESIKLTAKVMEVTDGLADYCPEGSDPNADASWQPVTKDLVLSQGAQIWTYDKGRIVLWMDANNCTAVVEQNTNVRLDQFYKQAETITTDIRITTGTIRINVEKSDVKTDMQIATPNATASVKGTYVRETSTSAGFGDTFALASGRISLRNSNGQTRSVSGGERTTEQLIATVMAAKMDRVVNVLPNGIPGSDLEAFLSFNGSTNVLPGDVEGSGNPVFNRIIQQELGNGKETTRDIDLDHLPPKPIYRN